MVREFARHRLLRAPMVGASSDVLRAQVPRPLSAGAQRSHLEFYHETPRGPRGRRLNFGLLRVLGMWVFGGLCAGGDLDDVF